MRPKPLISVIITFLNAEKFMIEAIQSVFAQTYTKWELLLVDDGSSDQSTQIALEYVKRYPDKVQYLEHEQHRNRGISASRNLGISKAGGKYVATLDADDVWLPNKLEDQVLLMELYPEIGMVFGNTKVCPSWEGNKFNNDDGYYEHDLMEPNSLKLNTVIDPPTLLILRLSGKIVSPTMSDNMFRKKVIDDIGGYEEIFTGMHEDQALWAKIFLSTPVFISELCWTLYRVHPESCVSVALKEGRVRSAELFYLSWLENYLSENQITNTDLQGVLQKRIWLTKHTRLDALFKLKRKLHSNLKRVSKRAACHILPLQFIHLLLSILRGKGYRPPVGCVYFGDLYRFTPITNNNGIDRGTPIDRYYKEKFLDKYSKDISGRVLEISIDGNYGRKFGGDRVTQTSSLDLIRRIRNELENGVSTPPTLNEEFHCIIYVNSLGYDYDVRSTINILYRHLKPGGTMLATIQSPLGQNLRQIIKGEYPTYVTPSLAKKLFEELFPAENLNISGYGNLLTLTALQYGLAAQEIKEKDLDFHDPNYEIITAVKAVKAVKL